MTRGAADGPAVRLQGVEAARGVAALLVVLVHASGVLAMPKHHGAEAFGGLFIFARAGVDFFFVLSGFIIAYVHAGDVGRPGRVGAFAWKRFARIYPAYWIASLMFLALLMVSPTPGRREQDPLYVLWSLLLLPTLEGPMLGQGWSLIHELLFYGLFALGLIDRRLGRTALALWAAGILLNIAWSTATGQTWFTGIWDNLVFRVFNIQFFFGMAVAALALRGPAWRPRLMLAAGTVVFFGTGLLDSWGPRMPVEWPPKHLAYALGSALALYGLVGAERQGGLRVPRVMVSLGAASYALYLTHLMIVLVGAELLWRARPLVALPLEAAFLLLVAASVLAALLFYRLVERPLLQRLRQPAWVRPRRDRPEAAALRWGRPAPARAATHGPVLVRREGEGAP
jgi:peptidoglycan/LPS O-acetylase OafA/YrhL